MLFFNADHIKPTHSLARKAFIAILLCVSILFSLPLSANLGAISERNRLEFRQAIKALEAGDYPRFRQLSDRNRDYLLYPYLHFYDIRTRLSSVTDREIDDFIKNYADMPLSGRVRRLWIEELAKQKRWPEFVSFYTSSSSPRMRCLYLKAKYDQLTNSKAKAKANDKTRLLNSGKKLWMTGKDLPDDCTPLIKLLRKEKLLTRERILERIRLAIKRKNFPLSKHLAKSLNKKDRRLVKAWTITRKNATKLLKMNSLKADNKQNRQFALETMQRYARSDAEKARKFWTSVKKRYTFSESEMAKMQRYLALRAAYQLHPKAFEWLKAVKEKWVNDDVRIWRVRSALRQLNWSGALSSLNGLSESQKKDEEWQYWIARVNEHLGNGKIAKRLYKKVAKLTNFYGFMASDRINNGYTFAHKPLKKDPRRLALLESLPGIQRSQELYLLDRLTDARREWNYAVRKFDEPKIKLAAVMAYNWQWYHNAITTVARTSHRADYRLRFATPFKEIVTANAENFGIDKVWIYGIIRRESAFKLDARSHVGATGLMQLMPGTARLQAKRLGLRRPSSEYLLTPEGNIQLGSSYLSDMLRRFDGVTAMATAAYNAGPRRVEKWIPENLSMPMDVWIDTMPYKETREYVKAVMAYATIFEWRLNESVTRLSERMGKEVAAK